MTCILWNLKVHKNLPVVLSLSQINSVYALPPYLFKTYFNTILPSTHMSPRWSLSFIFPHQNSVCIFISPIQSTCHPFHVPQFDHLNNTWYDKLLTPSLHNFPICYFLSLRSKHLQYPILRHHILHPST